MILKKLLITLFIFFIVSGTSFGADKEHIDIAFGIDNNYPIFTLLAIDSILENNRSESDYTFWILENDITPKNKAKMEKFVEGKGQEIKFINVDTSRIDAGKNLYTYQIFITPIAMARILLPDLLPKTVHKVLYLDADILVTDDLLQLYNEPLDNYIAGMVLQENQDNEALDLYRFKHGYHNSGVILINLDRCREENSTQEMVNFIRENESKFFYTEADRHSGKKWLFPDQDVINIIWDGKIKHLHSRWNNQCMHGWCLLPDLRPGIIHYIGHRKPWHFIDKDPNGYYLKPYNDHWKRSPFALYRYYYAFLSYKKYLKSLFGEKLRKYKNN